MKKRNRILTALLSVLTVALLVAGLAVRIVGTEPPFTGAALTYYHALREKGFPDDYAARLTRIHLLYPAWEFEPLTVSRSWKEAVSLETANPRTNLISGKADFSAYRHADNQTLYDSGYYQASAAAVAYFLDPRNFLSEADLFQFYEQKQSGTLTPADLDAVLAGTFMEDAVLENGKTYAEYLVEVGEDVGVDPVFLAVKLRQEQGSGTSPLLTGKCGTLLADYYKNQTATTADGRQVKPPKPGEANEEELLALNGYYNLFNIKASGDGVFSIYRNALTYAKSHNWNTGWKALRGGAKFLSQDYISKGQSTIYLQKFDVNTAGNPHQYMQNVGGALSEGRLLYGFFAANGLTDRACTFRIPVYKGMPTAASADPAKGECATYAAADTRYSYQSVLRQPVSGSAVRDAVFGSASVNHNATLTLLGSLTHTYGAVTYEYAWDGGEWQPLPVTEDGFGITFRPEDLPAWGDHLLTVRACHGYEKKRTATHTLCAAVTVTVVPPPKVTLTLRAGNAVEVKSRYMGDRYTFPLCNDPEFAGYVGSDGTVYPSGYELILTRDTTYTAIFLTFRELEGAALYTGDLSGATHLRFEAEIPLAQLNALPAGSATLSARLFRQGVGSEVPLMTGTGQSAGHLTVRTPDLVTQSDLHDDFSVTFSATLRYSDGSARTLTASGSSRRSAAMVAAAALADTAAGYSEPVKAYLRALAER